MPIRTSRFYLAAPLLACAWSAGQQGAAQTGVDNASYVTIEAPGSIGTFAMGVNDSMVVTGYYLETFESARGFMQDAQGNITTFNVPDAVWTEPLNINAAGDVTGFFEMANSLPRGFIRYPDGRISTFDLPPGGGGSPQALPINVNDHGVIAGNTSADPNSGISTLGFQRSTSGVVQTFGLGSGLFQETTVTALNNDGTTVGYFGPGGAFAHGFYHHPDGFSATFDAPAPDEPGYKLTLEGTLPQGISNAGEIVGFYDAQYQCLSTCGRGSRLTKAGAFLRGPQGNFLLLKLPGPIAVSPKYIMPEQEIRNSDMPGGLAINEAGTVTGSYIGEFSIVYGFVREGSGAITSFIWNDDFAVATLPTSINDQGVIVGSALISWDSSTDRSVGFIRIPQ